MAESRILTARDVDTFAERLKATIALAEQGAALRAALDRLTGGAGRGRRDVVRALTGGRRRAPVSTAKVLEVLKGSKTGMAVSEIADKVGESSTDRVRLALTKLRSEKAVKLVGKKRMARWHAS